jgi:hypothetical protein
MKLQIVFTRALHTNDQNRPGLGRARQARSPQKKGKHMKKLWWSVMSLAVSVNAAVACCGHEEAIRTVLDGPEGAHAIVAGHRFAVQPPQMEDKQKSKYTLTGQLTRLDRSPAKDDVISYRIVREKGAVRSIDLQINGGMWLPMREAVMDALGDYRKGAPMPEEQQHAVTRALEKQMDGSWQRAAEFLIAHIAARHC